MTTVNLPPVSIGLPFFNAEDSLLDSIKSVFVQTHQDWELILMDDGSTDRSLEVARSIDDPRVRVFSDGQNKKLAARLNEIRSLAKFDFIARMDADDLMSPERIRRQLQVLVENPGVDLVSTGVCSLDDYCRPVGLRFVEEGRQVTPRGLLSGQSGIVHASIVGRRDWFLRNSYKETLPKSQDTNLWVRAYARNDLNVMLIRDPLYFYREDGNLTSTKLLLGYRMGRETITRDATSGFPNRERIRAYTLTLAKSAAVRLLDATGQLHILRRRRNRVPVAGDTLLHIEEEIRRVKAFALPIRSSK